jgi:hypothetical protein
MFTLPPGQRNEAIEPEVRVGLRNSFNFKLYLMRKEIKPTNLLTLRLRNPLVIFQEEKDPPSPIDPPLFGADRG